MEIKNEQYLNEDDLMKKLKYIDVKVDDLISADSYNEQDLINNFSKIDGIGQILLFRCAIHIAVIGYGNRTYGMIRDDNENVQKIEDIFKKYNVNYNRNLNEKYDKSALSSRRLLRLFRYHIQKFIIQTGKSSYLWNKYSDGNIEMIKYCFPGAEHLIKTKEEAFYLTKTYNNLDIEKNTKFVDRLERVFVARKICSALEYREYVKIINIKK